MSKYLSIQICLEVKLISSAAFHSEIRADQRHDQRQPRTWFITALKKLLSTEQEIVSNSVKRKNGLDLLWFGKTHIYNLLKMTAYWRMYQLVNYTKTYVLT